MCGAAGEGSICPSMPETLSVCAEAARSSHSPLLLPLSVILWYLNTLITGKIFSLKPRENLNTKRIVGPFWVCRRDLRTEGGWLL